MIGDNKTLAISFSCQGESHKATNKVCQDYSLASSTDSFSIAIVCDGHGGDRYFRSDVGAKYAAEVTLDSISQFVANVDESLFEYRPFIAIGPTNAIDDTQQLSDIDKVFRRLFSSIISKWNERIEEHAKTNSLSDWEKENVPQKYLDEFVSASSLEKHYGCTLMAYVQTTKYWFAFHLGDGKCISFQKEPIWKEPIPWDENCFLNKTTSLCDSSAIDEFRYCYEGNGHFPIAVFLGSDGLDDSFGESDNLANFYIQILKMLAKDGVETTEKSLEETLPELSRIGSKDDMSVACVFNLKEVKDNVHLFLEYQLDLVKEKLSAIEKRLEALTIKRDSFIEQLDKKSQIEYKYALQDIEKAQLEREELVRKYDKLATELSVTTISTDNKNDEINEDEHAIKDADNAESSKQINDDISVDADEKQDKVKKKTISIVALAVFLLLLITILVKKSNILKNRTCNTFETEQIIGDSLNVDKDSTAVFQGSKGERN